MKIEPSPGTVHIDIAASSTDVTPLVPARPVAWRRIAFWLPIAAATATGTACAVAATAQAPGLLRWPLLALLAFNLGYIALTGMPAIIGAVLHAGRRRLVAAAQPTGLSRTAIVMPVHNEDPRAVFAAIEVTARAVADAGLRGVDIFVLSDTSDEAIAAREAAEHAALEGRVSAAGPAIHYRRRAENGGRKAGNLAEFCDRWGGEYDYMLVLDADSLMGAGAIARLVGLMDANPRLGIVQTVPYPVGRGTLFARIHQFSARLYTPLLVEGLTWWQQADGNYWGHNAIIRIAPFRAHCALPVLPGREPWGGEILCHDVVEAALMGGAGWDCWVLPQVMESYEALPANLVDYVARERRWCQGNLQHKGVLLHPRMRAVGRFHLAYGISHYLAAPATLLSLVLAIADALTGGRFALSLLHGGAASAGLIGVTAFMLYGGKLATLAAAMADPAEARGFGGRAALLASAVLEQLAVMAVSAALIAIYARYVLELVLGRTVRWDAQARDDRGVSWAEAWRRMRVPVLLGLAWLAVLPFLPHGLRMWSLPLLLGLVATVPFAALSSRLTLGTLASRLGLFLTPEEQSPAPILRAYQRAYHGVPAQPARAPSTPAVVLQLVRGGEGA